MRKPPPKEPSHSPEFVRDISEQVYRIRLELDCLGNVDRMIAKDEDNGQKLRGRAKSHDALTRAYLKVLEVPL